MHDHVVVGMRGGLWNVLSLLEVAVKCRIAGWPELRSDSVFIIFSARVGSKHEIYAYLAWKDHF